MSQDKTRLVLDLDAHKGDGLAEMTQLRRDIFTMSIHMKRAWPLSAAYLEKSPESALPNNIDLTVEDESQYLAALEVGLKKIPKDFDFALVIHGADVYEHDELESTQSLKLSLDQIKTRDQMVLDFINERQLANCWTLGGGYGPRTWEVPFQFLSELKK